MEGLRHVKLLPGKLDILKVFSQILVKPGWVQGAQAECIEQLEEGRNKGGGGRIKWQKVLLRKGVILDMYIKLDISR